MKNNKRGFTIIELLAVITMIGILSTVVFTSYTKYIKASKVSANQAELVQIVDELENEMLMHSSIEIITEEDLSLDNYQTFDQLEILGAYEAYQKLSNNGLKTDAILSIKDGVFEYTTRGVTVKYNPATKEFL